MGVEKAKIIAEEEGWERRAKEIVEQRRKEAAGSEEIGDGPPDVVNGNNGDGDGRGGSDEQVRYAISFLFWLFLRDGGIGLTYTLFEELAIF